MRSTNLNLLAIETSTDQASVALLVNGKTHVEYHEGAKTHAQVLLLSIARLLTLTKTTLSELDGIVFGEGPGSFTGLRVACSVAKGLAYGQNLPVYPVSTLAAIAAQCPVENCGRLVMLDARMNQVYWSYGLPDQTLPQAQVSNVADIICPGTHSITLMGVGWEAYVDELSPEIQARIIKRVSVMPNAQAMIDLVERGLIKSVDAGAAMPVYVRNQVA